jgi:hypothetical protein
MMELHAGRCLVWSMVEQRLSCTLAAAPFLAAMPNPIGFFQCQWIFFLQGGGTVKLKIACRYNKVCDAIAEATRRGHVERGLVEHHLHHEQTIADVDLTGQCVKAYC